MKKSSILDFRRTKTIIVNKKYGILVDEFQYISGLIYFDKKNERNVLTKKRYFSKIENALADIAERTSKDELQETDYSLSEAVSVIKNNYEIMSKKWKSFPNSLEANLKISKEIYYERQKNRNYQSKNY